MATSTKQPLFKIMHIADLHLGQKHLHLEDRFRDFFIAFASLCETAIKENVDGVVICGDMFDRKQIDAETLFQTTNELEKLQKKHIPVFAIEGNHDQRLFEEHSSFLDYLSQRGVLHLLRPTDKEKHTIDPWDDEKKSGAAYTIKKDGRALRLFGIGYITQSIQEEKLQMIEEYLKVHPKEKEEFVLLMMHGSVATGSGGIPGSISHESLLPFKKDIDYIGLGHWHRRMEVDNWIYNPGSMEHTDINRDDISKGYFLLNIYDDLSKKVEFFESGKRPIFRTSIKLKKEPDLEEALAQIKEALIAEYKFTDKDAAPVCRITLRGKLACNPLEITKKDIEHLLGDIASPLYVELENLLTSKDFESTEEYESIDAMKSSELEKEVLTHFVEKNTLFKDEKDTLPATIQAIKDAVLSKQDPKDILQLL